ncbi:YqhG family protein, partial [Neobacillus sp. 19]
VRPKSGMLRIENYLKSVIEKEDHSWAEDAKKRWDKDLNLLNHFYEDVDEENESYETEKKALQEQYEPKINISFINGGLFYLTENAI